MESGASASGSADGWQIEGGREMKAPDKLYVHITPHLGLLEATAIPVDAPGEQVYIRKDALMEWVKEHKCVIETHGDERDAYLRGEYSILNSLIDKLNSM